MATPRTAPLARPRRLALAVALVAAAFVSVLPAGSANADPGGSIAQVQRRVDALNERADIAVEQYEQAKIALAAARRRSAVTAARVRREQAALHSVQSAMAAVASSAYRSGGSSTMLSLVATSTPQTFLDRASSLNRIARGQAERLAAVSTARRRLAGAEVLAARDLADQRAAEARVSAHKSAILRALAEQRSLLAGLKAEERARLARLQAERRAAAERSARLARASRYRSFSSDFGSYTGPASGRAGVAVAEAYNKLGSPYEWGASGPNRFDCSGLTMWAWGKAGVSLSHSSQAQYGEGRHVSRGSLQPGDLVFYGSPIHHVGIYIGGGRMISAPHSGDVVKIQDAFRSDYAGAVRP